MGVYTFSLLTITTLFVLGWSPQHTNQPLNLQHTSPLQDHHREQILVLISKLVTSSSYSHCIYLSSTFLRTIMPTDIPTGIPTLTPTGIPVSDLTLFVLYFPNQVTHSHGYLTLFHTLSTSTFI